ncbi:hypothetical protein EXIGLDRAFT_796852 [Exidia glandulosa HHB12029]|uniref:Uncharacterized protein n=1 Tax=Exidia glandulosa HHB12029 TaxID=1314781 RepID=A0A165QIN6_EXIGL|nr:hypothetical protein EXIGLDRAFT_796852 [Exidia glandulosa HHB12029]
MHEHFYRLVPRYSRSPNGLVILYGAKHPAVLWYSTFEELETQLINITYRSYFERAGLGRSKDEMLVVLLREQVQHINVLWRLIRTQPGVELLGYCTSPLDVQLCDALDTFSAMEEATIDFTEYRYTRKMGFRDIGCTCFACLPDMEHLTWMWRCARIAHAYLPQRLFDRVFKELKDGVARG